MSDHYLSRLNGASESYRHLGWSVIPVYGDTRPGNEKQASVNWKPYQRRKPTPALLDTWFSDKKRTGGLAVVTGRVSNLMILDFDDEGMWELFRSQYPDLCKTRTVRTPNGWHLYFEIAPTVTLQTNKRAPGIDLLWEGCYALLPPTTIRGSEYRIEQGGRSLALTQAQADRIMTFVNAQATTPEPSDSQRPGWGDSVLDATLVKQREQQRQQERPPLTESALRGLYRWKASPGKRNNALFECAIEARDSGWPEDVTHHVLVPLHIENQHPAYPEPEAARRREAVATIKSAYSRPPRKNWRPRTRDLPNNIKERLLFFKLTCAVRIITGLRKMGLFDGEHITLDMAMDILTDPDSGELIVGEHSIKKAFGAVVPDGDGTSVRLFEMVRSQTTPDVSVLPPHAADAAATPVGAEHISKCLEMSLKKPHFSPTGKPFHWYRLPSDVELADKLRLEYSRIADVLTLDDIRDAKTTRMMIHYRFIERKPGFYHSEWLSGRLGVTIRTKNTYDEALSNLYKQSSYYATALHPGNLAQIPEETFGGLFLQDNLGHKYPAERGIARRLIGKGRRLLLMQQGPNYYWTGNPQALQPLMRPDGTKEGFLDASLTQNTLADCLNGVFWPFDTSSGTDRYSDAQNGAMSRTEAEDSPFLSDGAAADGGGGIEENGSPVQQPLLPDTPPQKAGKKDRQTQKKKNYHRKFRDPHLERIANRVKERINALCSDHQLSISSARRLIHQFGYKPVWRALHQVEYKYGKGQVKSPPGMLTIIARGYYKANRDSA